MRNTGLGLIVVGIIALFIAAYQTGEMLCAQEEGQEYQQQETKQDVTLPEFIVIFDYPVEGVTLNLRLIIRAKTEGEAVMRATLKLVDNFRNQIDGAKLRFIEVALKPNPDKKK